jgi:hypothetical protein
MQSLSDLNGYSDTEIEVTDDRLAKVVFDRAEPTLQLIEITSTTVPVTQGFEIEEIINYVTANCRYEIKIVSTSSTFISGSTITFPALPSGVALFTSSSTFEKTFTLRGIEKVSSWDQIKAATWTLPSGYSSVPVFYLEITAIYYDEEQGKDINFGYLLYDPDYYYVAELNSVSTMTTTALGIKEFDIAINSEFLLFDELRGTLLVEADLDCNAISFKRFDIAMTSTSSMSSILTGLMNNTITLSSSAFLSANPLTTILAVSSITNDNTGAMDGMNFYTLLGNSVVKTPISSWTTGNGTGQKFRPHFNGSVAITHNGTSLSSYNWGGGEPFETTPSATLPTATREYVNTDIARASNYNLHFAVLIANNNRVYADDTSWNNDLIINKILLYDNNMSLLQTVNIQKTSVGSTPELRQASFSNNAIYLAVSYVDYNISQQAFPRLRVYKRSSNTLSQIYDTGFQDEGSTGINGPAHHCQTPDGAYVFLTSYLYNSRYYMQRWNRSGDTYSQTGTFKYEMPSDALGISAIACTSSHLAVFLPTASENRSGYLRIYTIGSGGALTFIADVIVSNPDQAPREVVIHWTEDSEYLIFGETIEAPSNDYLNQPLRIWRRAGTSFNELTINYSGDSWPTTSDDLEDVQGVVGISSKST